MSTSPQFICFRPDPAAHMPLMERAVLQVLRDVRGFLRSSGASAEILAAILRHRVPAVSLRSVETALESLRRVGLADQTWGLWKEARG